MENGRDTEDFGSGQAGESTTVEKLDGAKDNESFKGRLKAYQLLVRKEAAYQLNERKAMLREKVEQWKVEIANIPENGTDPLLVFPEEIWTMILEQVTDWKDLASCAKANHLFDRILMPTKVQWHFEKVLPFVLKFLVGQDVLDCRLVCKLWCSSVDNFLESCKIVEDPCKDMVINNFRETSEAFLLQYYDQRFDFGLPRDAQVDWAGDLIEEELRIHPRNPFIGRTIKIRTTSTLENFLEPLEFMPELVTFLGYHGKHVWHLALMPFGLERFQFRSCAGYYSTCATILTQCSNLRSLFIDDRVGILPQNEENNLLELDALPHHAYLETVQVEMKDPNGLMILDKVVEKYSSQLKRLGVHLWKDLYHNYPWENLRELEILTGISSEMVDNLTKLNAPKLRRLGLWLEKNSESSSEMLVQLVRLLSFFSNVDCLELVFAKEFVGFRANEIISLPAERTFSPLIVTVDIDCSSVVGHVSFDLLISFPCLRTVTIRIPGHRNSKTNQEGFPQSEILQISKFLWKDTHGHAQKREETMYSSNVWEELPSLQMIKLCYFDDFEEKDITQVYSRQGYLREKIDKKTILNSQLNCAHREADRQNRMRSSRLRQQLRHEGMVNENIAEMLEGTIQELLFKKILPTILTRLDKSDILSCRQVCKKWCAGVDNVLESYYTNDDWKPRQDLEPFTGSYTPA